jgi:hypothetical protein
MENATCLAAVNHVAVKFAPKEMNLTVNQYLNIFDPAL